jgi:putative transposase
MDELERKIILMRGSNKSGAGSRKAKKYLIEQLIARGFSRDEVSSRLGMSRKTVYNILKSSC